MQNVHGLVQLLLGRARGSFLLMVLASAIGGLSNIAFIAVMRAMVTEQAHPSSRLIWTFAAFCFLAPAFRSAAQILLVRLAERTVADLVIQLCHRVLATPLKRLEEVGSHRILAALTDDVVAVTAGLMNFPTIFLNVIVVGGCFWFIWRISPGVLACVTVFVCVAGVAIWFASKKAFLRLDQARVYLDATFSHLRALTIGTKELKLHAARKAEFLSELVEKDTMRYRHSSLMARGMFSVTAGMGQFFFYALLGFVFFVLPRLTTIRAADLTAVAVMLLFVLGFIEGIWNAAPDIGRAAVALRNLDAMGLKLIPSEVHSPAVPPNEAETKTQWQIELAGVTHAYRAENDNRSFVLGPIDLTLSPGEIVFVVGGNGSGKTTFAKLLTGLYTPAEGQIYLNGSLVSDEKREEYRQLFAAVFSDFYLFDRLLGVEASGLDERAREYLVKLQLDHKVRIQNGLLSTVNLSQGQRKRLALLTACLEDRPIYVFDEWAADQDGTFKDVFYHRVLLELKAHSKAVVVITHDERYYDVADRVIKLEEGRMKSLVDNTTVRVGTSFSSGQRPLYSLE